jgi:hypothetical protein
MIENKTQLMDALYYIESKVDKPVEVYLIGGSAFLWHGLKDATKDVDLCVSFETANTLAEALRPHGSVEHREGVAGVTFLKVKLPRNNLIVQIYIQSIYSIEDYNILQKTYYTEFKYRNLTVKIPDIKTLTYLKDIQIQALYREYNKLKGWENGRVPQEIQMQ